MSTSDTRVKPLSHLRDAHRWGQMDVRVISNELHLTYIHKWGLIDATQRFMRTVRCAPSCEAHHESGFQPPPCECVLRGAGCTLPSLSSCSDGRHWGLDLRLALFPLVEHFPQCVHGALWMVFGCTERLNHAAVGAHIACDARARSGGTGNACAKQSSS